MTDVQKTKVKVSGLLPVDKISEGIAKTKHKTFLQYIKLLCGCLF
jgi:hypothetical protein